MAKLTRVGLTGGIAAGKSTVARRWQQSGASLIDTDALAHQCLAPETPTWRAVVRTFGRIILKPDQSIDRRQLGEIVFADEQKRLRLNRIIHPAVQQMWQDGLAALEREGPAAMAVVVIPLLYEVGVEQQFDRVVVVACSEAAQMSRLRAKGLEEGPARARIRAQWPTQMKVDRADFVIWNDGLLELTAQQADMIWDRIKENQDAASKN